VIAYGGYCSSLQRMLRGAGSRGAGAKMPFVFPIRAFSRPLRPLHPWRVLPSPILRRLSSPRTNRAAPPQPLRRCAPQGCCRSRARMRKRVALGVRSRDAGTKRPFVFPIRKM
jgi:hypothetical protein